MASFINRFVDFVEPMLDKTLDALETINLPIFVSVSAVLLMYSGELSTLLKLKPAIRIA